MSRLERPLKGPAACLKRSYDSIVSQANMLIAKREQTSSLIWIDGLGFGRDCAKALI